MFNPIDICSFIPVVGCVDMGPSALLCPGACNAVKGGPVHDNIYLVSESVWFFLSEILHKYIYYRTLERPKGEFPTNIKELRTRRIFKFPKI